MSFANQWAVGCRDFINALKVDADALSLEMSDSLFEEAFGRKLEEVSGLPLEKVPSDLVE